MKAADDQRLSGRSLSNICRNVGRPGYDPTAHGTGIVHIGLGAFHRAHQAAYTDTALAASGGDWRIAAISMRSTETAQKLAEQDGFYTLIEKSPGQSCARIIGSISTAFALRIQRAQIMALLTSPEVKIVSLTVTEKGYCYYTRDNRLDLDNATIRHDLAEFDQPISVPGLIVKSLSERRNLGLKGFTLLCCDNLPNNGEITRHVVLDFSDRIDPHLSNWIKNNVTFPSTMVDRITPETTDDFVEEATKTVGVFDAVPVQTEPFSQWVIEDDFKYDRPAWDAAGAIFVEDVAPYEKMKLRMLNGSHSLLAYAGHVAGIKTVSECMSTPELRELVQLHLAAVSTKLTPLAGVNYTAYSHKLIERFENPDIQHATYQIAMDGSMKMPQRIFEPAEEALVEGASIQTYAFTTAVWFRYLLGKSENGNRYSLRDPREREIHELLAGKKDARAIFGALKMADGLLPQKLFANETWAKTVIDSLDQILTDGVLRSAASAVA
ncbi:mannitol dehydrogenase family protein [Ruegeria profundi]|uniref:mannitol dehydrogenase family protein n=1 Tax=Ruegeria profundi TaxID=1685378 RepID=UPI0009E9A860|nr:mannitol dehydrogenase family protein [Ruegeria profundi]